MEQVGRSLMRLRADQAKRVMPLIGPLLDAWECVPNDFRSSMDDECPKLTDYLDRIAAEVER
jgi:hypothetical protein